MYYTFDGTVDRIKRANIQRAMDTLEELTCLQFSPRRYESDYILIRAYRDDGCSSFVGRRGGRQTLTLGPGCNSQGTILHELCHALGKWHEQSRPDRDEYVQVLRYNIEEDELYNFQKRNVFEVDSQGAPYDYTSVMHYSLDSFAKRRGLNTLKIINEEEYEKQGRPYVGYAHTLSKLDVMQINRLYNCPGSGISGTLRVHVEKAENLWSRNDGYVEVTAYDDSGQSKTLKTNVIHNSANPNWNTPLDFGKHISSVNAAWQYVDVSIWNYNSNQPDRRLTFPQSFSVNPGHHNRQHCNYMGCDIRLTFSISVTDNCTCFNGGMCLANGRCKCPTSYSGKHCEHVRGRLRIFVRNGANLHDRDSSSTSESDPFIVVSAYDHQGSVTEKYTSTINDDLNPVWNEWLDFGVNDWSWFTVQAWDEDIYSDQKLSYVYSYTTESYTSVKKQQMKGYEGGTIYFDYFFEQ